MCIPRRPNGSAQAFIEQQYEQYHQKLNNSNQPKNSISPNTLNFTEITPVTSPLSASPLPSSPLSDQNDFLNTIVGSPQSQTNSPPMAYQNIFDNMLEIDPFENKKEFNQFIKQDPFDESHSVSTPPTTITTAPPTPESTTAMNTTPNTTSDNKPKRKRVKKRACEMSGEELAHVRESNRDSARKSRERKRLKALGLQNAYNEQEQKMRKQALIIEECLNRISQLENENAKLQSYAAASLNNNIYATTVSPLDMNRYITKEKHPNNYTHDMFSTVNTELGRNFPLF